ncbi:hypothetical protein, conserved [Babesia bigemina]|uniref:4-methyl-5-beta-hydroxyethylthiazole kinase n=1 Tax=Babesia bigemina TaxID=5866 RepID=A0A061D3T8_BABBI|nr:hypothetical protein, conserved [Babesia bigemina]CDR94727.1 hypothetical protein, conserved [Babesia bigemina]|eukprot:XP_012766913.1 hypothetical protein, conserved [Babesia bigemina]
MGGRFCPAKALRSVRAICSANAAASIRQNAHISSYLPFTPLNAAGCARRCWSSGREASSAADSCAQVDTARDKVVSIGHRFVKDSTPEKLLELTSTYWRKLRYFKPLLLTCNVDKAIECRVADAVLASGAVFQSAADIPQLSELMAQRKDSHGFVGCYINVDSADSLLESRKEIYETLDSGCNAIMVDLNLRNAIPAQDLVRIDEMLFAIKPHIIRFVGNTAYFAAAVASDNEAGYSAGGDKEGQPDSDIARLNRCKVISERYNAVVIDNDLHAVVMNASDHEGAVFSRSPDILKKVHGGFRKYAPFYLVQGFEVSAGGIIATMIAVSSSKPMFAAIAAIVGIHYSAIKCVDMCNGPGSLGVTFVDMMHRISTSPDSLLQHDAPIQFFKLVDLASQDD